VNEPSTPENASQRRVCERNPRGRGGRLAVLLGLAALLSGPAWAPRPAAADDEKPFFVRFDDPSAKGHDAAVAEWDALSDEAKWKRLREGLWSDDEKVAAAAAGHVVVTSLPLADLRRLSAVGLRRPASLYKDPRWFGGADLAAWWSAMAAHDDDVAVGEAHDTHRMMRARDVETLGPLLERLGPRGVEQLLWDLANTASETLGDAHRAAFAHAFLYADARLAAEEKARADSTPSPKPPTWSSAAADVATPPGGGLPPAFVAATKGGAPSRWLRTWADDLRPVAADVPALAELVNGDDEPLACWAVRALARIDTPEARKAVEVAATRDHDEQVIAAAERAAHGDATTWNRWVETPPRPDDPRAPCVESAEWIVDVERTRKARVDRLVGGAKLEELVPLERRWRHVAYAVDHPDDDDRRAIAKGILERKAPSETVRWFFGIVAPELVTAATADAILAALGDGESDAKFLETEWMPILSRLEVVAPAALRTLAGRWERGPAKASALVVRAMLSDELSKADLEMAWTSAPDAWRMSVGRAKGPDVEAFLATRAASVGKETTEKEDDPDDALGALLVRRGVPEALAGALRYVDDARKAALAKAILAGDAVGAALEVADEATGIDDVARATIGAFDDDRPRQRLRTWRAKPWLGRYWVATVALASHGDAEAGKEWSALLDESRTYLMDDLVALPSVRLPDSAADLEYLLVRFGDNCCAVWQAGVALHGAFPTIPIPEGGPGRGSDMASVARAWVARTHARFAWSRFARGWVPAE
jgi:hypothetical protein